MPEDVTVLTWNIWASYIMHRPRTEVIATMIGEMLPDIIMLQEVTPVSLDILEPLSHPDPRRLWGRGYIASCRPDDEYLPPYFNALYVKKATFPRARPEDFLLKPYTVTTMDRSLTYIDLELGDGVILTAAVTHLESPGGSPSVKARTNSVRGVQILEAYSHLNHKENVVFGGDMNWIQEHHLPLPADWFDAWPQMKGEKDEGFTYDSRANRMLGLHNSYRSRLDRFLCKLGNFSPAAIRLVGTEAIPNLRMPNPAQTLQSTLCPVLPSDHFGVFLTLHVNGPDDRAKTQEGSDPEGSPQTLEGLDTAENPEGEGLGRTENSGGDEGRTVYGVIGFAAAAAAPQEVDPDATPERELPAFREPPRKRRNISTAADS